MLTTTQDNKEIIARVAALDIGKAELMCCRDASVAVMVFMRPFIR